MNKHTVRKIIAAFGIATVGLLGVACDDASKIDEDDGRFGPEPGPFR